MHQLHKGVELEVYQVDLPETAGPLANVYEKSSEGEARQRRLLELKNAL